MTDMSDSPIGQSLRRREDQRFLTGAGQYVDDVVLPGQSYGFFLRSPYAHARINRINLDAAKAAPGVLHIFTGADLAEAKVGGRRHADEGAAPPGTGARQGAACGRPGGAGGGRDLPASARRR